MSIDIQVDYIKSDGAGGIAIKEPKKFAQLSMQLTNLLKLQILAQKDRAHLNLVIKDRKIVLSYDAPDNKQITSAELADIETTIMQNLSASLLSVREYNQLIFNGETEDAKNLDAINNGRLFKMASILNKIESPDVELISTGCQILKIPQQPKVDPKISSIKSMSLFECRITKPEMIGPMDALFICHQNGKKITSHLNIPDSLNDLVYQMAGARKAVDIEFEYLDGINQRRQFTGSLTSINESNIIDTNIELEL